MLPTADICDKYPESTLVAKPIFKDFGGRTAFLVEQLPSRLLMIIQR